MINISENQGSAGGLTTPQPTDTFDSYGEMSEKVKAQSQGKKIVRLSMTVFALSFALYIVFYLCLPVFQAKSIKVRNNVLLQQEDLVTLGELDHYEPMFLLPSKVTADTIKKNSKGLVRACTVSQNGFVAEADIAEEFPCAYYQGIPYVSTGRDFASFCNGIASLPLAMGRTQQILQGLEDRKNQPLPELHLAEGMKFDEASRPYLFRPLADLSPEALFPILGYEFYDEHKSSTESLAYNVMLLLLRIDGRYFRLRTNADMLPYVFSKKGLPVFLDALKHDDTSTEAFRFSDSDESYPAAFLVATYNKASGVKVEKAK